MKIGIPDPPTGGQSSSFPLGGKKKDVLHKTQPDKKTKLPFGNILSLPVSLSVE
jgi:hypothetical protein